MKQYKSGNEFLPYHASASHTPPDFRDGWNACFAEAEIRITELEAQLAEQKELIMQMVKAVKQDRIEWEDFPPSSLLAFSKLITSIQAEGKA